MTTPRLNDRLTRRAVAIGCALIFRPLPTIRGLAAVFYGFAAAAFVSGLLVGWWLS